MDNEKTNGGSTAAASHETGSPSEASAATEGATSHIPSRRVAGAESSYVNFGLELWNKRRKVWLRKGEKSEGVSASTSRPAAITLLPKRSRSVDVDTIIESIFSTTGDARLPQPVPLSQMIDLLVDFWEADGLYD
ncbi:Hypothetical protein NocV09_00601150 [Nannochloropsis oceanica]